MKKYQLVLGLHHNGIEVTLLNKKLKVVHSLFNECRATHPKLDWIEHDALTVLYAVRTALHQVLQQDKVDASHIAGVSIISYDMVVFAWDRRSGRPLSPGISRGCKRSQKGFRRFKGSQMASQLESISGRKLHEGSPLFYFDWMVREAPDLQDMASSRSVCFGSFESWILFNLTGRDVFATDYSCASHLDLFDLADQQWSEYVMDVFDFPKKAFAQVMPSFGHFGVTKGFVPLPDGLPITGVMHQWQARRLGSQCDHFGDGLLVLGDQGELFVNLGDSFASGTSSFSLSALCTPQGAFRYGGKLTIPFPRLPGFFLGSRQPSYDDVMEMVSSVPDTLGVSVKVEKGRVPGEVKTSLLGLSPEVTEAHLWRAYLEAIACEIKQVMVELEHNQGFLFRELKVDGPLMKYDYLLQFLTDMVQVPLLRYESARLDVMGAGFYGAIAAGLLKESANFSRLNPLDRSFVPLLDPISSVTTFNTWSDR